MSYEGSIEYICEKGHLTSFDVYEDHDDRFCVNCGSKLTHRHGVNETNEKDPDDTSTFSGEWALTRLGWDEILHHDYKGNPYYTRIPLFSVPEDSTIWRKLL